MKKLLITLFLFCLPILCSAANAITITEKNMGYVSVNTSATKEVVPDTASVYFSVETVAKDSKTAVNKNKEITAALILALKPILALDNSDSIQTRNFILKPNYAVDKSGKKTFQNYTTSNTIFVKTKNLDNVSKLIDTAVANNVTNVGQINFYIENEKQYTNELAKEAINKAKVIADLTANTLNQKVKGIKAISVNIYTNNQYAQNSPTLFASKASGGVKSSTLIEYGKIKLQANVNAEFYVK